MCRSPLLNRRRQVPVLRYHFKVTSRTSTLERSRTTSALHQTHSSLLPPMTELFGGRPRFEKPPRVTEGRSVSFGVKETRSIPDVSSFETVASPHLELQLSLGKVNAVYSSRHYHFSMIVVRSLQRMRRGRPSESIKDYLKGEAKEPIRSIFVDTPIGSKRKSFESSGVTV